MYKCTTDTGTTRLMFSRFQVLLCMHVDGFFSGGGGWIGVKFFPGEHYRGLDSRGGAGGVIGGGQSQGVHGVIAGVCMHVDGFFFGVVDG